MKTIVTTLLASCVLAQAPLLATATPATYPSTCERPTVALARKATLTKNIDRVFDVEAVGRLELDNRHGDIDFRVSDDGKVRIGVLVTATAGSERKAQSLLDEIDVEISGSPTRVTARTELGRSGLRNVITTNGFNERGFEVDYTVSAPAGFALDLENSFGDVRLSDMTATAKLDVSYGDLQAGRLGAGSTLTIGFGDATVDYAPDIDVEVKYGELRLRGAGIAKVYARFSELELGRFDELDVDSQYGEYVVQRAGVFRNEGGFNDLRVDSAERLTLEGGYNDVRVGYLGAEATFDVRFGEVHIASTSPTLTGLTFKGNYTDLTAVLNEGLAYTLDAETSYGDIRYPSSLVTTREVSKGRSERIEGMAGGGGTAIVKLEGSFADLVIR